MGTVDGGCRERILTENVIWDLGNPLYIQATRIELKRLMLRNQLDVVHRSWK